MSIGLPVYNGERFLREAMTSILQQDYPDFELIVSDNASTDATERICREAATADRRVLYHRNETNIGAAGNYNRVFALGRGELFKWAAHDDIHLPGCLRRCVEIMEQAPPDVALVAPTSEIIDEHGSRTDIAVESLDTRQPRPHERVAAVMRRVFWAPAQFGLFRADTLRKTRLIGPFFAADNVLLVEVAALGQIWEFPEVLFQRRFHPGVSTEMNKDWRALQSWCAPGQRGARRFLPPPIRIGLEFLTSIARLPMSRRERLLCYGAVFSVWYPRQGRRFAAEWRSRIAIRTRLKKAWARRSRDSA